MISADPDVLRNLDEYWVHGRHRSGRLIAAEVREVLKDECAVWDRETGALVWRPGAHSIAWSHDGASVCHATCRAPRAPHRSGQNTPTISITVKYGE